MVTTTVNRLTDTELMLGFASLCIEATAKRAGCSYRDMYERLRRTGILHELTTNFDPLHTQSLEYVTDDILNAVNRIEKQQEIA